MNLEKLTKRVTAELGAALPDDISAEKRQEIIDIVRQALQDSSRRTHRELRGITANHLSHEADLAHKIQLEMDKKSELLISNLSAMQ